MFEELTMHIPFSLVGDHFSKFLSDTDKQIRSHHNTAEDSQIGRPAGKRQLSRGYVGRAAGAYRLSEDCPATSPAWQ